MEAAGELDQVADKQPSKPPAIDASIIGTELEICWRYWRKPTADEIAKGEKRKKIGVRGAEAPGGWLLRSFMRWVLGGPGGRH